MPEDLDSELRKVVFKTNEIALQSLIFVLVRLEVLILLLGHLFAKIDLLEGFHKFREEVVVRFILLLFVRSASISLLLFNQINVLLKLVVTLLQPLNLLLQQPDLLISMILPFPQLAILQCFIEKSLVPCHRNETRHQNGLLAPLLVVIDGTLGGCLISNLLRLLLLKNEVLVDLVNAVFLRRRARCHRFQVEQAVKVAIRFAFVRFCELIDRFDLALQGVFQLRALRSGVTQSIIDCLCMITCEFSRKW